MKKLFLIILLWLSGVLLTACWSWSISDRAESYYAEIASISRPAYEAYNGYTAFSQETPLEQLEDISLYTIRHHNESAREQIKKRGTVLLEQITVGTYQVALSE
jgi:hypothetical protein